MRQIITWTKPLVTPSPNSKHIKKAAKIPFADVSNAKPANPEERPCKPAKPIEDVRPAQMNLLSIESEFKGILAL